jgi:AbiV family abortive infection protein
MISLQKLSNIATLSFKNGLRLHIDSLRLFEQKAYPTSTMLSILSMEEFGKYFSLSSYVFYTRTNGMRDQDYENKYLMQLYSHVFKQKMAFGRDGFVQSERLWDRAESREFEELKQESIYVGFQRDKGNILYNKPYYNPLKITKYKAKKQVKFLNDFILSMIQRHIDGIISMDEEEVNTILSIETKNIIEKFEVN